MSSTQKEGRISLYDGIKSIQSVADAYFLHPERLQESRARALNEVIDGFTVDTVCPSDTGKWETGIKPPSESWIIVEQYPDEDAAKTGHAKWVSKVKEGQRAFTSIQETGAFDWND